MSNYYTLKKPEKPVEILSPPNSPNGQDFLTPKFLENKSIHKEDLIEKLITEKLELESRIIELTNESRLAEINYQIEIRKLSEQYKLQTQTIQDKYAETQFQSKISPLTRKCSDKIEYILNVLKEFGQSNHKIDTEINKEFITEEDDGIDISMVQEEGAVLELGFTQAQVFDDPLSRYNTEKNEAIADEKLHSADLQEIIIKKSKEIKKHKQFIKTLKASLENILKEHTKSKLENEKHIKEIADLKEKLANKRC